MRSRRTFALRLAAALALLLAVTASSPGFAKEREGPEKQGEEEADAPQGAQGDAPHDTLRGGLVGVELECDLRQCLKRGFRSRLAAISGVADAALAAGGEVSPAALERGRARLLATGFFRAVDVRTETSAAGVLVTFDAAAAITIRKLRVRAGAALGSELRRRIFLRAGETWTGERRIVARQEREIVAYFEDQGYFGTQVSIQAEPVSEFVVDVIVRVKRGPRKTVDRVYIRGHEALEYDDLSETILRSMNLMRTFTSRRFEAAQTAVIRRYRQMGYLQARVAFDEFRVDPETGNIDLFVEIREGPRWEIRFNGNSIFTENQLLEALTFYETGFIDDAEIEIAVAEIRALYETVGHFFADVGARYSTSPDGLQHLSFDIVERQTAEIRSVEFVGVEALDEGVLFDAIQTSEYDILSTGGYLQRSRLDRDVGEVVAAYSRAGYLQASVPRVVLVGENEGRDLYLTLHVVEGEQTQVVDVSIEGLEPTLARELSAAIRAGWADDGRAAEPVDGTTEPRVGRVVVFDPSRLRREQSLILADLHERGFAFASVATTCVVDGTEERVPCVPAGLAPERRLNADRDRELACERNQRGGRVVEECRLLTPDPKGVVVDGIAGERVRVVHSVTTGRRVFFGELLVRGNFSTRRRVIAREMRIDAGQNFDYQDLLEGQARLRSLGLFDSVRVFTVGATDDVESGDTNHVVVQLEESGSRFLEHRVSLEAGATTASNFLLILSNEPTFRDINVFGAAKELRVFGNFDFDVLDPGRLSLNEYRAGAGILYLARRFYLTRNMEDPWEAQVQLNYDYDLLAIAPAPLTKELAFDARIREESDIVEGLFFEVGFNVSQTETLDQSDPLVEPDTFDPALILSVGPRITFDRRRDNALNPTSGFFAQLELQLADDFIGVLDSERFTKITTRASGFIPLGRNFVLGINGRFGAALGGVLSGFQSDALLTLPLSERYGLGGVTTLRGFSEGGITSLSTDEFGGDFVVNGNVELRYPFLRPLNLNAAVFFDTGQLMADLSDFRGDEFRTTAGFGLRWIVADLIPIVFDYGAVLGRRPGEGFGRLHFNVGYTF